MTASESGDEQAVEAKLGVVPGAASWDASAGARTDLAVTGLCRNSEPRDSSTCQRGSARDEATVIGFSIRVIIVLSGLAALMLLSVLYSAVAGNGGLATQILHTALIPMIGIVSSFALSVVANLIKEKG